MKWPGDLPPNVEACVAVLCVSWMLNPSVCSDRQSAEHILAVLSTHADTDKQSASLILAVLRIHTDTDTQSAALMRFSAFIRQDSWAIPPALYAKHFEKNQKLEEPNPPAQNIKTHINRK